MKLLILLVLINPISLNAAPERRPWILKCLANNLSKVFSYSGMKSNAFVTNRDLVSYYSRLEFSKQSFLEDLMSLRPGDAFADLGAGEFKAIGQYYDKEEFSKFLDFVKANDNDEILKLSNKEKSSSYGFVFKKTKNFNLKKLKEVSNGKVHITEGNLLNINPSTYPKFNFLTDIMGVGSYTKNWKSYLEKIHAILKKGGHLYTNRTYSTRFLKKTIDGRIIESSYEEFFKNVKGLKFDMNEGMYAYRLTKTSEKLSIPKVELNYSKPAIFSGSENGTPYREFIWYEN